MRVRLTLTIDLDPEVWTTEYGIKGAHAIANDVRGKIREDVRGHLVDDLGIAREVYLVPTARLLSVMPRS